MVGGSQLRSNWTKGPSVPGSSLVVEEPDEKTDVEGVPLEVLPFYEVGLTPAGLECLKMPDVSFRWDEPVVPGVWASDTPLPEMDYCGYTVEGNRVCCPDK